jgi:thiol-disulfide isomerase/thioredoxin
MKIRQLLRNRWVIIPLEVLFFIALFLAIRAYQQRDMISGPAPRIEAATLKQNQFNLATSQPKPVLVHFWATWCGICKLEQDSIQALSEDYNVITIAMQSGSDQEILQYLAEHKLDFEVINDAGGEIVKAYGVRAVPASFIVNGRNQVSTREVGYTTGWGLRLRLWLTE